MQTVDFDKLYEMALGVAKPRTLTPHTEVGAVGAALLTDNIDTACSMGFCAEHAAAAAMVTAGENHIVAVIAVNHSGAVVPPCGRCRQFLAQLGPENSKAQVMVAKDKVMTLEELLPFDWREA